MTNFRCRPAIESDRRFIQWMDELTETFGDETQPLGDDYLDTRRAYVDMWDEKQGGVIIEATELSDDDYAALEGDVKRNDPFEPEFNRSEAFRAEAYTGARAGASASEEGESGTDGLDFSRRAVPVGAAWLRCFDAKEPGYGFVDNAIPEVAIAIRPAMVGRRLSQVLVKALLAYARELGYPGVSLAVDDHNPRAAKAYVRAGFDRVGRSTFPDHDVMVYRF